MLSVVDGLPGYFVKFNNSAAGEQTCSVWVDCLLIFYSSLGGTFKLDFVWNLGC